MIERDMIDREISLSKPQRKGLVNIAANLLACRSVSASELANALPRKTKQRNMNINMNMDYETNN